MSITVICVLIYEQFSYVNYHFSVKLFSVFLYFLLGSILFLVWIFCIYCVFYLDCSGSVVSRPIRMTDQKNLSPNYVLTRRKKKKKKKKKKISHRH